MNYKFRKKPITIEAFQMTRERRDKNEDWPDWLHEAWNKQAREIGAVFPSGYPRSDGKDQLKVQTKEGLMVVPWDAYIIRGILGELYVCDRDIFNRTYDPVLTMDVKEQPSHGYPEYHKTGPEFTFPGNVEITAAEDVERGDLVSKDGDVISELKNPPANPEIIDAINEHPMMPSENVDDADLQLDPDKIFTADDDNVTEVTEDTD